MSEVTLNIVIEEKNEVNKVLKKLEKQGYGWKHGYKNVKKPTGWKPECEIGSLQKWSDKKITWSSWGKRDMYKNITAKEFLGKNECIVIYRNKNETIALNKATKEKAVAKCSKDDTYDFITGAKLALDRLTQKEEKPEFKPYLAYNGKNYGIIGESTPFKDAIGRELKIGDTVELYNKANEYKGEHAVVRNEETFVMGIRMDCREDGTITDWWKIILKRKHEKIANGESVGEILYVKEEALHNYFSRHKENEHKTI